MWRITRLGGAAVALSMLAVAAAVAGETPSPPGAKVWIVWPKDGEVIHGGKLWVRMGARNIGVAPAGVIKPKTGHHHLIIDRPLSPFDEDIPADENHLHFGGGQTEARIELPPGKHTLQIMMGDHDHIPHNPPLYSERITVVVP
jgi:hypothetical protein